MEGVEEYRRVNGLHSISSTCFKAGRFSAILFDDGIGMDKVQDIEWHKSFIPKVGRILRVEKLAEKILNEVRKSYRHSLLLSISWIIRHLIRSFILLCFTCIGNSMSSAQVICFYLSYISLQYFMKGK